MAQLPADLERLLAACLQPGEEDGVAEVLEKAVQAPDDQLASFLDALAARIRNQPARVRAEEVRALLARSRRAT